MEDIVNFIKDSSGATAMEYAIIVGLIAVLLVASLTSIGSVLKGHFDSIAAAFT